MVPNTIGTFLTETWLTSDVIDAGIDIPGYGDFDDVIAYLFSMEL